MDAPNRCNFCQRPRNEVSQLVVRESAAICNRCIEAAARNIEAGNKSANMVEAPKEEVLPTPREIKAYLDEYVIGQEMAKRVLSTAVHNHYLRRTCKDAKPTIMVDGKLETVEIDKANILLLGPTGTGKSHLARTIARFLKVPFHVGDATRLTQAGYVGDDVESLIAGLITNAQGDVPAAEWGIVFLDEVDKLASNGRGTNGGFRDISGEGVQQSLLKLLEGSRVPVPRGVGGKSGQATVYDTVDTTNILFICAGSFAGIEGIVGKRLNKGAKMGFGSDAKKTIGKEETYASFNGQDLLDFGIIPEMLGRLQVLTSTLELSEEDMVKVLSMPKNSISKQYMAMFGLNHVDLVFTPESLRAIAREAKKQLTGARALRSIVERILGQLMFELPGNENVTQVTITEETVESGQAVMTLRGADSQTQPHTASA